METAGLINLVDHLSGAEHQEENGLILCAAPDKGWRDFAAESEHLICTDSIDDVLAYFNDAYQGIAEMIVEKWREGATGEYIEKIENAFELCLDGLDFIPTGTTDVFFESESTLAVMQYVDLQSIAMPKAIAADADTVTFTVRAKALVSFEAEFQFYIVDGIDRETVSLSTQNALVENIIPFDFTITAARKVGDTPDFIEIEVEVVGRPLEIDFGYLEAFPDEDPTHPYY